MLSKELLEKYQTWLAKQILHNLGEYYLKYNYDTANYEPNITLGRYILLIFRMWQSNRVNRRYLENCWIEEKATYTCQNCKEET